MGVIGVILVASFAIDRTVAALFFLLCYSPDLHPLVAEDPPEGTPHDERASRTRRLIYAMVGGYIGIVLIAGILGVHLFSMTQALVVKGFQPSPLLDTLLTGLVLAAGADRLAEALKMIGETPGGGKSERPIEIKGTLVLEQGSEGRAKMTGNSI